MIDSAAKKTAECGWLLKAPVILVDPVTASAKAVFSLTNQTEKLVNAALMGAVASPPSLCVIIEFSNGAGQNITINSNPTADVLVHDVWEDEFHIDLTNHHRPEKLGKLHVRHIPAAMRRFSIARSRNAKENAQ